MIIKMAWLPFIGIYRDKKMAILLNDYMAKLYILKYVFLIFAFLFLFSTLVSAAKPNVSGVPSTTDVAQSFQVNVTLTIAKSAGKNYYLRAAFFQAGTTQYFGYTKNHFDTWYNGTPQPLDPRQFKKVTMDAYNTWSGVVEVKPDAESSYYKGGGNYNFKIGYYTEGGSSISDWSDAVQLAISGSSPSPTPTPTPSLSPSLTPSPSPSPSPTPTVSPTPSSSPKPTPQPSPKLSPTPSTPSIPLGTSPLRTSPSPKVLGAAKVATSSPSLSPTPPAISDKLVLGQTNVSPGLSAQAGPSPQAQSTSRFAGSSIIAFGLMGLGLLLIIFSAYTFLKPRSSDTITLENE